MNFLIIDREFPPNIHGGIGTYNLTLAGQLTKFGHQVIVLTISKNVVPIIKKHDFGVVIQIPYRLIWDPINSIFRWLDQFRFGLYILGFVDQIIKEYSIDLIEVPSAGGYGAFLVKKLSDQIPVVTRFHGSLGKAPSDNTAWAAYLRELRLFGNDMFRFKIAWIANTPLWQLEKSQLKNSTLITLPSEFSRKWLYQNVKISTQNMEVIQNGVNINDLMYLYKSSENKLGGKERVRRILFAGRCSIPKGVSVLLRSLPNVFKKIHDIEVVFAGTYTDHKVMRLLQEMDQRFPGRIKLPGYLPHQELLDTMLQSELLVAPSFYEVCPMVSIEAMALGVPVVASNVGPFPEIVCHKKTGLLFEVGNSTALADAILELLSATPYDRSEMRQDSMV